MSMDEFVSGLCPQCGEALSVPEKLTEFSCMYCGARLRRDALRPAPCEAGGALSAAQAQAQYDEALSRLPACVRDFRGYQKKITKNEYEEAFAAVSAAAAPVFGKLDQALAAMPERLDAQIKSAVCAFLDALAADWQTQRNRAGARDDDKMVIAVFLVPAIRKLALPASEIFCAALQAEWVRRYPKTPFYLGDYDTISTGFRKKAFGLCFITTAVCEELGKPDDCAELTAFRAFRDGYLSSCPDGGALIEEYYRIAPGIVSCIELTTNRHETYRALREEYLAPCYADLQAGRYEACKARYVEMVRTLQSRFLS